MQTENEKKPRGGARPGAGRKKCENARNHSVALKLSAKAMSVLEAMAAEQHTNKNDVINKLLESLAE